MRDTDAVSQFQLSLEEHTFSVFFTTFLLAPWSQLNIGYLIVVSVEKILCLPHQGDLQRSKHRCAKTDGLRDWKELDFEPVWGLTLHRALE